MLSPVCRTLPARRRIIVGMALGLGGSLGVPLPLRAQTPKSAPRIGFLMTLAKPSSGRSMAEDMAAELRRMGYADLVAEVRYADGRAERLPALAQELVRSRVDVIVANQTPAGLAAQAATRTIPIVLAATADPVAMGLAQSLSRPGGNVTGISAVGDNMVVKNLELLRELKPAPRRLGALLNERDPYSRPLERTLRGAATRLGMELLVVPAAEAGAVDAAFAAWERLGIDAVFLQPSLPHQPVAERARQRRLPSVSFVRAFVAAGGLMAYGGQVSDTVRLGAGYVDRVLRGAKPAELPIQQPTKFDLVVNRKTLAALGIALPPSLELQVTEFID